MATKKRDFIARRVASVCSVICVSLAVPTLLRYMDIWPKLDLIHYATHTIILIALLYNLINSAIPLGFNAFRGSLKGHMGVLTLVLAFCFCCIPFLYLWIVDRWCFNKPDKELIQLSFYLSQSINLIFIAGGIAVYFIDLKSMRKRIANNVDAPFTVAVFFLMILCFLLVRFNNGYDIFALGVSSGGIGLQLVAANIMAPWGGSEDDFAELLE